MNVKHYRLPIVLSLLLALLLAGLWSCRRSKTGEESREIDNAAAVQGDDTLLYAVDNLNGLEEYNSADSCREILERFSPEKPPKPGEHIDPLLAAWPQPEMFREVVGDIQQWVRSQPPPADWKLDPMTATLPKPLRELPQVKNLGKMEFTPFDGFALLEASWLHDVSLSARGDVVDDLDRARNLFDWTVRNIQLEPDHRDRIPQLPRETLLFGRGTAAERAWVFILLLRQLEIDAAVLAIDPEQKPQGLDAAAPTSISGPKSSSKPGSKPDSKSRANPISASSSPNKKVETPLHPWCVGVLIEGEVYLFDPLLGLPIPGPDGATLDETGQLAIRPATLAQVAADPKLLRRLDFDPSHPYRVEAVDPKRVIPLLEASPPYLSRAMKAIDSHLVSQRRLVLTTSLTAPAERPTAPAERPTSQVERWKAAHVAEPRLWLLPFETIQVRSQLDWRASAAWLGDVLPLYWVYQERKAGGAKTSMDPLEYEESRQAKPSQVVLHVAPLFKGRVLYFKGKYGEDGAAGRYLIARPSHESLALSSESDFKKRIKLWAKQDASYWLGLMAFQRGRYASAIDYLQTKTLEAYPNGPWSTGARYNLARAYEASGRLDMAIFLYNSNATSPGYFGDLLRAKWLKELGEKRKPAE